LEGILSENLLTENNFKLKIINAIATGMNHLHMEGVIHGRLSPKYILITPGQSIVRLSGLFVSNSKNDSLTDMKVI
jgi:hypothetical protein